MSVAPKGVETSSSAPARAAEKRVVCGGDARCAFRAFWQTFSGRRKTLLARVSKRVQNGESIRALQRERRARARAAKTKGIFFFFFFFFFLKKTKFESRTEGENSLCEMRARHSPVAKSAALKSRRNKARLDK